MRISDWSSDVCSSDLTRLRADAVGVVIGDRLEPRFVGGGDADIAHDHRTGAEMVEQRRHLVFEQRQPVFHPRETAAVRNRLIERVAGRGRAEAFAVTAAEALDAVLVEQRFGCGQGGEAVDAAGGETGRGGGRERVSWDGWNLVGART